MFFILWGLSEHASNFFGKNNLMAQSKSAVEKPAERN